MTYLYLFTIGPVQSFIAQARKTRDLYAGSRILSELVRSGITACQRTATAQGADCTLIFPGFDPSDSEASLPNRFIVKLIYPETPTEAQLRALAGNDEGGVEFAVRKRFERIAQEALDNCKLSAPEGFWPQIRNHLDIHWAFQPMEAGQYKEAYLSLERLLGSVKNVRPFAQYTYQNGVDFGERGRKCSLDGENNALFFGPGSNRRYVSNNNALLIPVANENEGLSAVSFVKRYWDPKRFPSTAGIATLNVERNGNEFNLKCFDLLFRNDDQFEEQLYFEENLTEQYFHKHGLTDFLENPGLAEIRRIHKLVFSVKKLCSYYAVLAFDGDHMGKWLSGVNLVTGVDLESFHKELSSKLSAFGREAKNIVDNERGKTVYAGGDDYLGFLNLHYLFKTVKELRQKFHELVNNQLNGKGAGNELTFSAGIVVAHYKEPLGMVVQKARDMEKAAKDQGNRNAFGLAVVKASGEIQQTVYKWDQEPDSPDGCSNWEALEEVFEGLTEDRLSNKFITSLSEEMYRLAGTILDEIDDSTANATAINDGLEREIERLVKKARNQQKNVNEEEARQVSDKINKLKQAAPKPKTRNFIHSLHIADFLSRKIKPA